MIDEDHRVAHDHATERDQAEQRGKSERCIEDKQKAGISDQAEWCCRKHQEELGEALQLDHEQGQHHQEHDREDLEQSRVRLAALLDRAAHLDSVARRQSIDQRLQLRQDCRADRGWLQPLGHIRSNRQYVVPIAPPQDRVFEAVVDAHDLRERHPDTAAGRDGEVRETIKIEALGGNRARHDRNEVDALAILGDLVA